MSDSRISCFHELFASAQVSSAWVQSMVEYHRTTPHYGGGICSDLYFSTERPREGSCHSYTSLHIYGLLSSTRIASPIKMGGLYELREHSCHKTLCLCSCSAVLGQMQLERAMYLSKLDVE